MSEKKTKLPFFGVPKLWPFIRQFKPMIVSMIVLNLINSLGDILLPLFQRYALNHFVGEGTLDTLWLYIALYVAMISTMAALTYYCTRMSMKVEMGTNQTLRNQAFTHLQTLSFSYYNQNSVGYIHSRVMSDTERIGALFSWTISDGVWQLAYLIGAVIVMLAISSFWRFSTSLPFRRRFSGSVTSSYSTTFTILPYLAMASVSSI